MSIPRLDSAPLPTGTASPAQAGAADDPFDTALITRFAREFFSGTPSATALPASAPDLPAPAPSSPSAVAGIPSSFARPPADVPEPSVPRTEPTGEPGLTGGFPTPSPHVTPAHPNADRATDRGSASQPEPGSGAHDPAGSDSYAFGEPRCNGTIFGPRGTTQPAVESPRESKAPSRSSAYHGLALPGIEVLEAPDFYFLSDREVNTQSALPGTKPRSSTPALSVFDIDALRRDFPVLQQRVNGHPLIWLDNAATTQKPQSVIDATSRFYSRDNSNIHRAAHTISERATQAFEAGREKVRQFLGAGDKKEIVFLRGTTEAINLVAQSYGKKNIGQGDEIILTELEHHANIVPWQLLAEQVGAVIRVVPIDDRGELIVEEYVKLLGPRTKFVSVAHVSNSLGTINPVEQIIALAHAQGVPVLIDGAQSTPHLPVNVTALDADFYVFSAHKIFGPTGIGALYGKSHLLEAMPPWQGGGHMIRDVRFEENGLSKRAREIRSRHSRYRRGHRPSAPRSIIFSRPASRPWRPMNTSCWSTPRRPSPPCRDCAPSAPRRTKPACSPSSSPACRTTTSPGTSTSTASPCAPGTIARCPRSAISAWRARSAPRSPSTTRARRSIPSCALFTRCRGIPR
ncbi:MAG: aminotransferase class V-fold PLP-dependent enzyme [Chthoniobacter sp.]